MPSMLWVTDLLPDWSALHLLLVLAVAWIQLPVGGTSLADPPTLRSKRMTDIHGGVKMGVSSHSCDDAKTNLTIDGDPRTPGMEIEFLCLENDYIPVRQTEPEAFCQHRAHQPLHKCMDEVITYSDTPPLSGAHRPLWPVYGEYLYLPPQRWLHSLEHGAVVLLYHPCADPDELRKLRSLVRGCIRRHIITPYRQLTPQQGGFPPLFYLVLPHRDDLPKTPSKPPHSVTLY